MTPVSDALRPIADAEGAIRVLAVDHRDSLRAVVGVASDEDVIAIKADLVEACGGLATGVMLDPAFGMHATVRDRVPTGVGIIAALEAQGYLADETVTHTTLMDEWNSALAAEAGARAAKFLALWDGTANPAQSESIAAAIDDAHRAGLPLVLEPLPRGFDSYGSWVVDWARAHAASGADLFKLPYPGSSAACHEISSVLDRPWTVLSAGVGFEEFRMQFEVAAGAGAAGYIVGRAVWREAATVDPVDRAAAIVEVVAPRLRRLAGIPLPPADPARP